MSAPGDRDRSERAQAQGPRPPPPPGMRRKSSAQNLLSSFKGGPPSSSSSSQPPSSFPTSGPGPGAGTGAGSAPPSSFPANTPLANYPASATSSTYTSSYASSSGTQTPTTATMPGRDWDTQSHVESVISRTDTIASGSTLVGGVGLPNNAPLPPVPPTAGLSPALPPGTSIDFLRDTIQKRIITLTYMRNVHDGRSHWFHTVMMSRGELDRVFNNTAMKKRTYRFAILGMSLAALFDNSNPGDLLRGMLTVLNEHEQSKEDSDRPKMGRLFRGNKAGKQPRNIGDYAMSYSGEDQTSLLISPQIPFSLDYHQVLLSLLDVLSESYNKILRILGPSFFPSGSSQMNGPLGQLSPHPGVSYLFAGIDGADLTAREKDGPGPGPSMGAHDGASLWGIANANGTAMQPAFGGQAGSGGQPTWATTGASPPPSWAPVYGDLISKIDTKLKKIISTLLKELDTFARNGIKDELATLDPLLRNVAIADLGREQFDFEGNV